MHPRILIVARHPHEHTYLLAALRERDIAVTEVRDMPACYATLRTNTYDVVLLDLDGAQGVDVVRSVRTVTGPEQLLFGLFSYASPVLRADMIRAGLDLNIAKVDATLEIPARLERLGKRSESEQVRVPRTLEVGPLIAHLERAEVVADTELIALTTMEYRTLVYFMEHPDRLITVKELLEKVWGDYGSTRPSNVVAVHVSRIRKKLGKCSCMIQTTSNMGYMLVDNMVTDPEQRSLRTRSLRAKS